MSRVDVVGGTRHPLHGGHPSAGASRVSPVRLWSRASGWASKWCPPTALPYATNQARCEVVSPAGPGHPKRGNTIRMYGVAHAWVPGCLGAWVPGCLGAWVPGWAPRWWGTRRRGDAAAGGEVPPRGGVGATRTAKRSSATGPSLSWRPGPSGAGSSPRPRRRLRSAGPLARGSLAPS
jgi:hypothetical protein